jgi:class 3 adenylate cyclase
MAPAVALTPAATGTRGMDPTQTQVTELLIRRRRSAILAADVAGYSRLMGANEEQTLKRLDAARTIMDSRIRQHGGRIANTAGDSVIAEFNNPVDAVRCAVEVQTALRQRHIGQKTEERLQFRIGINYGEVMANRADLLGDNVNVAARIENLAQPGGILISESVHEQVYGRINVPFRSLGQQALKNIDRKIVVFEVMLGVVVEPPPIGARGAARPAAKPAARAAPSAAAPRRAAKSGAWPLLALLGVVVLVAVAAIAYLVMTQLMSARAPTPAAAATDPVALAAAANAALPAPACARLLATVDDPPTVTLTGYVGAAADLDAALSRLQAVPGVRTVANRVAVLPPPLCGALGTLPAAALTAGGSDGPRLDVGGANGLYRQGETLRIAVTAPAGADGHLYIDYVDAQENSVIHLLPNDKRTDNRVAAGQQAVIGDRPGERYQVRPPFGTNMILVVSTRRPLFAGPPPLQEARDAYLARLAAALQSQPDARLLYAPIVFAEP